VALVDQLLGSDPQEGGHAGAAEIDVAGRGRDRDRLGRFEEDELGLEPLLDEIALPGGDEDRRRPGEWTTPTRI
jgi:hypothetical protein